MDKQQAQSSAVAEAMAAVHDAMVPITVQGKPLDDHDLRLLIRIKSSCVSDGDLLPLPLPLPLPALHSQLSPVQQ